MKIRIDPHLERFEVISQLKKLIIEYSKLKTEGFYKDDEYSFNDYLYSQSISPVQRFLSLCIPKFEDEDVYNQMLNYWTSKFQTARGTLKIFDYLEDMGGIMGIKIGKGNPGDEGYVPPYYYYDTKVLEINFTETETTDMNLFVKSGSEFFKSLLYFQDLRDTYEMMKLDLSFEISVNLSAGSHFYSSYTVTEGDEI